ncbi:MAG TPA: glycosyltransferase [Pyrinomonadaceae bacterium]|nr:glycosyltransferase [Pyrinomonadaceae bacterium]
MSVSVSIAAWNGAEYLREALASVAAQTLQPLEVVVVDDGSTDHTAEVCASFAPLVKYFYQENDGTSGATAHMRSVLEARGEFIAFLDQDDRWLPTKLEKQVAAMRANPAAGAVFTDVNWIDEDGNFLKASKFPPLSGDTFHTLLEGNRFYHSSAMVSRAALCRSGVRDLDTGMGDWDQWLRIARHFPVIFIDEYLTEYRVHAGNYSVDKRRIAESTRRVLERYRQRLHPGCRQCVRSFRAGWRLVARAYLDHYHIAARTHEFRRGANSLAKAVRADASYALSPRQLASVAKSVGVAAFRAGKNTDRGSDHKLAPVEQPRRS